MILDRAEILSYLGLGSTVTTAQDGRLNMIQPMVEDAIKGHLGYRVEQATYTHFLPASRRTGSEPEVQFFYDVQGGKAIAASAGGSYEHQQLLVPELPIRSVTNIWEDTSARGGQGATDFAASTLLTAGIDYWVDYETSGLSKSGLIYRTNRSWSGIPRTIKAAYTAGYTQTELSTGIAATIKSACLDQLQFAFGTESGTTQSQGPIVAEKLGDYSVTYGGGEAAAAERSSNLTPKVVRKLQRFVHYGRFF